MSWAERALGEILERAGETELDVGDRWPLYADPATGRWTTTARGSWTAGFWAGLVWLRATITGADRSSAASRTASLAPWAEVDTATRGLIFWYGTALSDDTALRDKAARACLDAYDPVLGLVPWGTAFGGVRELARVDALPGLIPLLSRHGLEGERVARRQLELQIKLTLSGQEAHPAWAAQPDGTWVPHPDPPVGWSRTVGWLALAVADSGGPHRILEHPAVAARFAPDSVRIPPASARRFDSPPDTSAAAVEAVAALKLAARESSGRLRDRAADLLGTLVSEHVRAGRLLDGCYDFERGVATSHELVWGDFFLALGLAILTGAVAPFAC
ncbi:hypothetical protein Aple_066280 [Acrocarpospora pleiomorpha]|uniref:Sugar ABC transporter permease n=1 Tax=Acrocarpospora pleiomorpha TaxID=90975 RepID=A0A5M3XUN3_9ACTN|nr:sugar ABC transporter permease [Acrocarpospora pleiomorpha]GES23729.1 hypothetical protein Aple_066280 [Acrocarpospora pleiomorpha]